MTRIFYIAILTIILAQTWGQDSLELRWQSAVEKQWVDSIYSSLSQEERLGQLFVIRAHSDKGPEHIAQVESLINQYKVGGLCFFQGTPEKQADLTNRYQSLSAKVPLMISIDAEWGLGMRMKESVLSFPRQLTLGAIQDNDLLYEFGTEVAKQLKRIGTTVNFAPVVDINNNAANPVIHTRSFGEDRFNVAIKGYMYMKGMQDHGVLACAKHFPGHGDTDVDSHLDLPVIPFKKDRLDSLELYPFQALIDRGIGGVMIAHLSVPELDDREHRPTTLSRHTITNLLREEMGFDGLVFTDALEMKGVTKYFSSGEVSAEALLAGNDQLLLPEDMEAALNKIKTYLQEGKLESRQVEHSVKRVLRTKFRLGLTRFDSISVEGVRAEINSPAALALKEKLYENALTLVRNQDALIPIKELNNKKFASLAMGAGSKTRFQQRLDSYAEFEHFNTGKEMSETTQNRLLENLGKQDLIMVGLHNMSSSAAQNYGISQAELQFLTNLNQRTQLILVVFGTPYSLGLFDDFGSVLMAYEEDEMVQDLAAQGLFGVFGFQGKLPVTASEKSTFNTGKQTQKLFRLGYSTPQRMGLDEKRLKDIERLANIAIDSGATPGCVVLVAKQGRIVYHEAFGHQTYAKTQPMRKEDVFDLASVTKIAASTLAVMRLQDDGLLNIDQPVSNYLPSLTSTNKASLTLREIMAHHAGLKSWIKFYEQTISRSRRSTRPLPDFYAVQPHEQYTVPVTDKLYLRSDFPDTMLLQIEQSDLRNSSGYYYSDLGFYLIAQIVKELTGKPIDQYVGQQFYDEMGLRSIGYNPLDKIPLVRIVPTEEDKYFRHQKIHGYVHDMGAAMWGGVSGHAGLFSNAADLAAVMQMLLQKGFYGGQQLLNTGTVNSFTTRYAKSTRRGIGFDMKEMEKRLPANVSELASENAFGHVGFTGTCAWADPETDLVFIFLANRTYPSMHNNRLNKHNYRPRIQSVVYEAIEKKNEHGASQTVGN